MADLLTRSEHSLIMQSFQARERREPLNGDGFGVGWYNHEIDDIPCVFTSVRPAWSNRNLARLADKVTSTCFFAHVRAATAGSPVSDLNCHPFQYEQFMWMHNGRSPQFHRIKRQLCNRLREDLYNSVLGNTDSEHAFALFLNQLWPRINDYSIKDLQHAMTSTIKNLEALSASAGIEDVSHFNFAVGDGRNVVVSRYASDPDSEPESLYYAKGGKFGSVEGVYRMIPADRRPQAVIVASEPLTANRFDWCEVPKNHLLLVTPELHLTVSPIV